MGHRLLLASKVGDVNALYFQIRRNPDLLEHITRIPCVTTPLHIVASLGITQFVLEIMRLMPSFARKANEQGFTPIYLALQNGHFETVRGLVKVDRELIKVRGRRGKTPFHCAAERGDVALLELSLTSCPLCIEDLTFRIETALHLAFKNNLLQALRFLFGWTHRMHKEEILNWKDEEGKTILHLAVRENRPKAVKLLINNVDSDARNSCNITAVDIFNYESETLNSEIGEILDRASAFSSFLNSMVRKRNHYLGLAVHFREDFAGYISNVVLVVAVLIATSTYEAVLSPPGGYWPDDYKPDDSPTNPKCRPWPQPMMNGQNYTSQGR